MANSTEGVPPPTTPEHRASDHSLKLAEHCLGCLHNPNNVNYDQRPSGAEINLCAAGVVLLRHAKQVPGSTRETDPSHPNHPHHMTSMDTCAANIQAGGRPPRHWTVPVEQLIKAGIGKRI